MASHLHHDLVGENLIDAARNALVVAGEQWTDMRADVFEALAAQHKPASAYDIAESVGQRRGKRVAANSVYRILDLFVRTNLARRVESANAYVANPHPGCRHDCIFLICDPADKPRTSTMTADRCPAEGRRPRRFCRCAPGGRNPGRLQQLRRSLKPGPALPTSKRLSHPLHRYRRPAAIVDDFLHHLYPEAR
jgi:Fur family zinc uptake transcriptional regulator